MPTIDWAATAAWFRDRLSEPTTRAGIVGFLSAHIASQIAPDIINAGIVVFADVISASLVGIHHKPRAE